MIAASSLPESFGRYRTLRQLGRGGMATVYLAELVALGVMRRLVAVKRIHPYLVEDDDIVDMFLAEARLAGSLQHGYVAQVFDVGRDDESYWLAMEYLDGLSLRDLAVRLARRGRLMVPEIAARVAADAARGLHAAHELRDVYGRHLGIVHRDISPQNLMVTCNGFTKVIDFGVAKLRNASHRSVAGRIKGKLPYMSPEQSYGRDIDRRSDVFSLGIVLFEITTGQRLFKGIGPAETIELVRRGVRRAPSEVLSDYPLQLEAIVLRALEMNPVDRYATARDMARDLENFIARRFVGREEVGTLVRLCQPDAADAEPPSTSQWHPRGAAVSAPRARHRLDSAHA